MKIISNFSDYYDKATYSTSAELGVYQRTEKKIDAVWMSRSSGVEGRDYGYMFHTQLIGFCGKLYPFIEYRWHDVKKETSGSQFFYSYDEYIKERDNVKHIKDKIYSWRSDDQLVSTKKDYAKLWFDCNFEEFRKHRWMSHTSKRSVFVKPNDLFLEHKVPYFFLGNPHVQIGWSRGDSSKLTLNPKLANYKFGKIKDAWTCYQDIEMFMNNEIVRPDDPFIAPVSDKIKAESHGFDKYSFRSDKGKKKRKKKS